MLEETKRWLGNAFGPGKRAANKKTPVTDGLGNVVPASDELGSGNGSTATTSSRPNIESGSDQPTEASAQAGPSEPDRTPVASTGWPSPGGTIREPDHSPMPEEPPTEGVEGEIVTRLREVFDPEIPASIYDIGLIYNIDIGEDGHVHVRMTLTSPNCPEAELIPSRVQSAVLSVDSVETCEVELVWEPVWGIERLSEEVKLELNLL